MSSDKRKEAVFIQSWGRNLQGDKPPGTCQVLWPAPSACDLQMVGRVCWSADGNQASLAGKVWVLSHPKVGRGHGVWGQESLPSEMALDCAGLQCCTYDMLRENWTSDEERWPSAHLFLVWRTEGCCEEQIVSGQTQTIQKLTVALWIALLRERII